MFEKKQQTNCLQKIDNINIHKGTNLRKYNQSVLGILQIMRQFDDKAYIDASNFLINNRCCISVFFIILIELRFFSFFPSRDPVS